MSRYARKLIQNGQNGWDGNVNDNFQRVYDRPLPPYRHSGDKASLQAAFAGNTNEHSLSFALYETGGGTALYISDEDEWFLASNWKWMRQRIRSGAGPFTLTDEDSVIVGTGGSAITVNLSASVAGSKGRVVIIKHNGTSTLTIDGNASETIDGATTLVLNTQYERAVLLDLGTGAWARIG